MSWRRQLAKLGALFRRPRLVDDLEEEIRSHLRADLAGCAARTQDESAGTAGIVGMTGPPFLLTIPTDLVVLGVGVKLAAVILPPALALAIRSTAGKLVGMITGKLKELLAVAAVAIAHRAAPDRDACGSL